MNIAHTVTGSGEPVLFIQGVGVPGCGWTPQVESLSRTMQCAVFDNRGVGASAKIEGALSIADMVSDAVSVLDALGWERAHVVGHSIGGVVATQLALDVRARVASLTLLCTFALAKDAARMTPWILWTGTRSYVGTRGMRRRAFLEIVTSPEERRGKDLDAMAARLAPIFGRDLGDPAPAAVA